MKYWIALFFSLGCTLLAFAGIHTEASLRDKIGQMLLIGFDGTTVTAKSPIVKAIESNNIGGVILFDYNYRTKNYDKNIESPRQVKQLNDNLQYFTKQGHLKHHRAPLPLLISVDYEGGQVTRISERYGFPSILSPAVVGKSGFETAESTAETMAQTLENSGFNLDFSPLLDVNVNPDNPIIGKKERSFSPDPNQVAHYADIYSRHFLNHKIQCVYKHFPGHGSSTQDSHLGFVDVTQTWHRNELDPYRQLLGTHTACGVVMSAHIVNRQLDETGLPATLSHRMLTGILRHQLHFDGVIITDDLQMKAISDNYSLEDALTRAINAGADLLIFGNNLSTPPQDPKQVIDIIETKVRAGEIDLKRINEAYQRILKLKQSL